MLLVHRVSLQLHETVKDRALLNQVELRVWKTDEVDSYYRPRRRHARILHGAQLELFRLWQLRRRFLLFAAECAQASEVLAETVGLGVPKEGTRAGARIAGC